MRPTPKQMGGLPRWVDVRKDNRMAENKTPRTNEISYTFRDPMTRSRDLDSLCRQLETELAEALAALEKYIREYDNPAPDLMLRRNYRDKLRAILAKHKGRA